MVRLAQLGGMPILLTRSIVVMKVYQRRKWQRGGGGREAPCLTARVARCCGPRWATRPATVWPAREEIV
jgi:hypothetical protein